MNKLKVLLMVLAPTLLFAAAGDVNQSYVTPENASASFVALTAATNTATFDVSATLPSVHTVMAVVTGSPTTCTISLQGSLDGTNWDTISAATTCTSTVSFYTGGKPVSKIRANLTVLGGGSSPTVTVFYAGVHGASAPGTPAFACNKVAKLNTLGAATTQIVALAAGTKIYVCGMTAANNSATATNIKLVEGTGANCGSGTADLSALYVLGANTLASDHVEAMWGASGAIVTATAGDALCVTGSAAGSAEITITYQQF